MENPNKRNRFHEKDFYVNGVKIEEVPMKESALHYDNVILRKLCFAIMCQALQDWEILNRGGVKKPFAAKNTYMIYRHELKDFFNGSFFGDLLTVIAPSVPQDVAIENMKKYPLKVQRLGRGRGKRVKLDE